MKRRIFLVAMLLAAICSSSACMADALDDILQRKVLKVAVPLDFPPFGSIGADKKPMGYDIDVARRIARELGVEVELVPVSSTNRVTALTSKKVDLVISSLGKNPEREKIIDFSMSYAPFFSGVYGTGTDTVEKVEDLAGKTIGVTRGSLEEAELSKALPANATVKHFDDNNATIGAFASGQVQFIATGNVVAGSILAKQAARKPEFKFIVKNSPCSIGVNKNEHKLLERVNAIITKAKQDGSLNGVAEKWLNLKRPVSSFL